MNADVRELVAEAERQLRAANPQAARAAFVAAGDCAREYGLTRAAVRLFRRALELDLVDRAAVERIARVQARLPAGVEWYDYLRALDAQPAWPHFGCRGAQIVVDEDHTRVTCPGVGPVLDLLMSDVDRVELHPVAAFATMPRAMALVIVRRALWIAPREQVAEPMTVRVVFAGRAELVLDELGDW